MEENQDGMTPIHIAAKFGHIDILRLLSNYMPLDSCSKMVISFFSEFTV
jgi:ankyrin repeat protein